MSRMIWSSIGNNFILLSHDYENEQKAHHRNDDNHDALKPVSLYGGSEKSSGNRKLYAIDRIEWSDSLHELNREAD